MLPTAHVFTLFLFFALTVQGFKPPQRTALATLGQNTGVAAGVVAGLVAYFRVSHPRQGFNLAFMNQRRESAQ